VKATSCQSTKRKSIHLLMRNQIIYLILQSQVDT